MRKSDGSADVIIGVLPQAFEPRPADDGRLSTNWLEFFHAPDQEARRKALVAALSVSSFPPPKSGGFTSGQVTKIREACAQFGHQVRIIHDPEDDNQAHALVTRYPETADELFAHLADEVWNDWFLTRDYL